MRPDQRVVTQLPLKTLWRDDGSLDGVRVRELSEEQIRELLRRGPIRFVVADVGSRLEWIDEANGFGYWKEQVSGRVADPAAPASLDDFPGASCYFASEWSTPEHGRTIVLLERQH